MTNPFGNTISETMTQLRRGSFSVQELVEWTLQRIQALNPALNAYISFLSYPPEQLPDVSLPLGGIPVSVKDLILTKGFPTTAGSRVFGEGIAAPRDATLVHSLRRAGAIIIGKTNLHEFAYGVTGENSHFGSSQNPWQLGRTAGGSSSGSAVAVAAQMGMASIGTDTRGSIRIPAAGCGITGLKPTLGLVPTKGVIPLSTTMDHAGPMTRNVEDCALILEMIAGNKGRDYPASCASGVTSLKLGICDYYRDYVDPEFEAAVDDAIQTLRRSGLEVELVRMSHLEAAHRASVVIAASEAFSYHKGFLSEHPDRYDPSVLKRLRNGSRFSGVEMVEALQARQRVMHDFDRVFREVDCLVGATIPATTPRMGEDFLEIGGEQAEVVENLVRFTAPQDVAGVPALTLPCGLTSAGLPVGLQFIAAKGREDVLFRIGAHFQRISDWHLKTPADSPD
jgi:aspartyl-tRNA(Asn)/glutamyl-tRNA(Gln) amidotransferase subunit A